MYDVYNNAFNLGGQLNINLDRYLVKQGEEYFLGQSNRIRGKYEHRSEMNDVTFRVGVVVIIFYFILVVILIFFRNYVKKFHECAVDFKLFYA